MRKERRKLRKEQRYETPAVRPMAEEAASDDKKGKGDEIKL